jgi:methylenetetrahydrofolate reductase (NADPH)
MAGDGEIRKNEMKPDSKLASKIEGKDFIVTAEYVPPAGTSAAAVEAGAVYLRDGLTAVNAADNVNGIAMSSLAASLALMKAGVEPVYQLVTRDRNRIALESDLLGAASLGIKNVLCLTGYHQSLMGCPESANVFDIDSIQLIAAVKKMNEGSLIDGRKIDGGFSMLIGAVANPSLKPLDLNMIRLRKKIAAGASFIQTQAVFDVEAFKLWLEAARKEGLTERAAILAGVWPLTGADEAKLLAKNYTDIDIPAGVIARLEKAGDAEAQKKEGLAICAETVKKLKGLPGLRGIHIISPANEAAVPQVMAALK